MDWLNFSLTLPVTDHGYSSPVLPFIILFAPILLNKIAYTAHHRYDSGGIGDWRAWLQYLGARQQFRVVRQGSDFIISCSPGTGLE